MSLISWNCRGLGTPRAIRALKDIVRSSKSHVVGLLETKSGPRRCEITRVALGFHSCFCVPARGRSGGLALFWKDEVKVVICYYSSYHIDFTIETPTLTRFTLFYGAPRASDRSRSWNLIRHLSSLSSVPWCLCGDFNEILSSSDSSSSSSYRSKSMASFRSTMLECDLTEVQFTGSRFTYSNRRKGVNETKCRLDRAIASSAWLDLFPNAVVNHLTSYHSDHSPIQLSWESRRSRGPPLFRLEQMWNRDMQFKSFVSDSYSSLEGAGNILDKLGLLASSLQSWNRSKFGNVQAKIKQLRTKLENIKNVTRTEEVIKEEQELSTLIDEWIFREEVLWRQRSRIQWLQFGDGNTSFFHNRASLRRKVNFIRQLEDNDGSVLSTQAQIKVCFQHYFQDVFKGDTRCSSFSLNSSNTPSFGSVSVIDNHHLLAPFTERDIYAALHQISPSKAPGLDGFPAEFFQQNWALVKNDLVQLCLSVLNDGANVPGLNDTLLVLIPKSNRLNNRPADFRPISLTTVASKIISKAWVNRLKDLLPGLISSEQSAFLKDRLISDNFIIAHECAHYIKNKRQGRKKYGSLKLDITKAYDRLRWEFIEFILMKMGFDVCWVNRIMTYIKSVRYCVRVNDEVSDFIVPERGLRQGDPLSPYLFIICAEWFSRSLSHARDLGRLNGVRISRNSPPVLHLLFADDSIIFFEANASSVNVIKSILDEFELISGQKINYGKSEFVISPNCGLEEKLQFQSILHINLVQNHQKYLGLPLLLNRNWSSNFSPILDKAASKCDSWMASRLSSGGKEVLIKAVLMALPQFFMQCFLIPSGTINKYDSIIKKFWWGHNSNNRASYWLNFALLRLTKEEGGLGFKELHCMNLAFLAKQTWRILSNTDLPISKILKGKYFPRSNILHSSLSSGPSQVWRSIYKAIPLLRSGLAEQSNGSFKWNLTSSGCYDVRSGYNLQFSFTPNVISMRECGSSRGLASFWNALWKLPIPKKVKIFAWRCYHDSVPVGMVLIKKHITTKSPCPVCFFEKETLSHALLSCWWCNLLWKKLGFSILAPPTHDVSVADFMFNLHQSGDIFLFSKGLVSLWYIWFIRNKIKHDSYRFDVHSISHRITSLVKQYLSIHKEKLFSHFISSQIIVGSLLPWDGLKLANCDGSFDGYSKSASFGIVLRNADNIVQAVRAGPLSLCPSVVDCEGQAILAALTLGSQLGIHKLIIESDSMEVVSALNCKSSKFQGKEWFSPCLEALNSHASWFLFSIRREANSLANDLAVKSRISGWSWFRTDASPRLHIFSSGFES